MYTNRFHFARPACCGLVALAACVALIAAPLAGAQAPAASGYAGQAPSTAELENLVGPIALYPDDLVALILPASTNPLQIVQADRFLEKRKKDPKLSVDDAWDDSVKSLVNYPDVVKKMSEDLDWTGDLGEAVVADQAAVLDAVQGFRRKAQTAGNLKTDTKQTVIVETEVIKIVPADPQVIYVPQYNPTTVVTYSAVPAYGYYPAPYPSYYYPYPPGAALATGLIWGAALGAAWNGNYYGTNWGGGNNNITINRGDRTINTGNLNRASARSTQATAWRSDKRPGQVRSGSTRPATTSARFNNARPGDVAGGARASTQRASGMQDRATRRDATGAPGRDALGGYGSGSATRADSSRGAASRSAMASQGGRSGAYAAGGGRASTSRAGSFQGAGASRDALGGYRSGSATRADSFRGGASRGGMSSFGGRAGAGGGRRGGGGRGR